MLLLVTLSRGSHEKKLHIYYDGEADFLEISLGKLSPGYFRDIGEGISERIDEKTGKVVGVAVMNFRKRIDTPHPLNLSLPFDVSLQ